MLRTAGDYVKVMYDSGQGADFVLEGYVAKNFVAAIPAPTPQYLNEDISFGKQIESIKPIHYPRGPKVSTYFTTVSGYTYISVGNTYGFVKTISLSKDKVIDKLLQKIEVPTDITFDTTKQISSSTSDNASTTGVSVTGQYKPGSSNTLEGTINTTDGIIDSDKKSSFQVNVTDQKLVYRINDMTITLAFPLKVEDAVNVNGKKYKIEKILEKYTTYSTVKNAIFTGDFVIGKGYLYEGSQH